jgi:hypothetical protein
MHMKVIIKFKINYTCGLHIIFYVLQGKTKYNTLKINGNYK